MPETQVTELRRLYSESSKHSNYQVLPECLRSYVDSAEIETVSRYEEERLAFMKSAVEFSGKAVLDVGGNTGFFSFESLNAGAKSVTYFEGNKNHADFVSLAARLLSVSDRFMVKNEFFDLNEKELEEPIEVGLLLNVLHHIGDDYGSRDLSVEQARKRILDDLISLSYSCPTLVFQLGFNWKGDRRLPLFESGTKHEMLHFLRDGLKDDWRIDRIGVAEKRDGVVSYHDMNDANIERDDSLGEFLNRPLFVLKSIN